VEDKHNSRWLWFLIVALCATAVGKVVMQDVPRIRLSALRQNDVNQLYLGSRVWIRGENPYSIDTLFLEMKRTNPVGAAGLNGVCTTDCHLYYPPSALPVIALLSWMPWKLFHAIYLATCILVYLFVLYRLSLLIEKPVYRCLFIALGTAFGPYHSGLDTNNISALLIPLLLLSTLCLDSVWAFALIAVIATLKPPLVLVLLLYYLLRRDRRVLTVSAPIILAISAISLFRLRSIPWWPTYLHSIHDYAAGSATLGVTNHGILNFGFSNLQALYYVLFNSAHYAAIGNYVTLILLGALFTWSVLRWPPDGMSSDSTTLAISIVGCLTLFQSSLQYYNYVFLLAAGVFALGYSTKGVRIGLVAALCSFVFPPNLLLSLSIHGREPVNAMVQLAHRGWKASQLTHGQELLGCFPSIIFFLIALCLVVTFQLKRRQLAASSWGSQPILPALLGQKRIARISNLSN
jgi:Glycosyltransferase family 87